MVGARFTFGRYEIGVTSRLNLPAYDWDEKSSEHFNVALVDKNPAFITHQKQQASAATVNLLQQIFKDVVGRTPPKDIHIMNMTSDGLLAYRYLVENLPAECTPLFLEKLCRRLELSAGFGSYEFLGSANQIGSIVRSRLYQFEGFPSECRNYNNSSGKTPFALGRASFQYPLPNISSECCFAAAELLDKLGDQIPMCYFTKKYLQWNLGNGKLSPRTNGNYTMLSRQSSSCLLFIGLEQCADEDPSVRKIVSSISPVLSELGVKLKIVPHYR